MLTRLWLSGGRLDATCFAKAACSAEYVALANCVRSSAILSQCNLSSVVWASFFGAWVIVSPSMRPLGRLCKDLVPGLSRLRHYWSGNRVKLFA